MRDGEGNKLSPEEQARVKSIEGDPGAQSTGQVSIDPQADKNTGEPDKSLVQRDEKPAAGLGQS